MKRYEKESLLKNFFVFFSLLEILLILLFTELYRTEKREYHQTLFQTMQVCSYTLECEQFTFDFVSKESGKPNTLYGENELYSYFQIPKSDKFYIKIAYPPGSLQADMRKIISTLLVKFVLATLLLLLLALFFTFYSLRPIRKALHLNDEFVKDILHDFNTPVTSMMLNLRMFKEECGENIFVKRISHSIDTLLFLQNNLKSFLYHSPVQSSEVNIAGLAEERMQLMSNAYPKISFSFMRGNMLLKATQPELLARILDNLLSNAAKYNKSDGKVTVRVAGETITIEDTGKGIENVDKVMQRYYKEQERGLGIGLHIVKKLVTELGIGMRINSHKSKGTTIVLDFRNLPEKHT
ncbi:HAMP domain-containing sensor histidine kinase [Sulfurovum sp.]|uniref:sensor histidine kinase n=1 Tax=Sulfurovum sp. TaxID=1969726 RepID=UPI0025CDCD13|nr:HAMP domain-containing sensor histidine kinase [Sulfurovum sp.]